MYKCTPLYIPSNLGETELHIGISPGFGKHMLNPNELRTIDKRDGSGYRFDGFLCFIWVDNVKEAQRVVAKLSRKLETYPKHPIQSDRLYFMPLFSQQVGYKLTVAPKKHYERPVIRVSYYPEDPQRTWNCEIYTSNLVQLQEALFMHERNLLKKRLQVLERQAAWNGQTD